MTAKLIIGEIYLVTNSLGYFEIKVSRCNNCGFYGFVKADNSFSTNEIYLYSNEYISIFPSDYDIGELC